MLYNQQPLTEITTLWRRIELRWKGLPLQRFTPVPGGDGPRDPYATYLPLPVARLPVETPAPRVEGKLNLLCVAKLGAARKNQPLLIETIEKAGLTDRLHLTLIGTPPKPSEAASRAHGERVEALSEKPWITLVDRVPFQDMAAFYAAADACVLPSFRELHGMAPREGMAYGAVPILSDECGSAGELTDGEDGFVVDMHKPDELGRVLTRLCDDPGLRRRIGAAAQATAERDLSEARFIDGLHAILARFGVATQ
nr:glycosyltransferase family 4 protein [Cognatishimia sp. F0-27]